MSTVWPYRCTTTTALVRGAIAAARVSGSTSRVSGVDVGEPRRRPAADDRLDGGDEGIGGHDDLVARADPEGAQGQGEGVGSAATPTTCATPQKPRTRLERLDLRAPDEALCASRDFHAASTSSRIPRRCREVEEGDGPLVMARPPVGNGPRRRHHGSGTVGRTPLAGDRAGPVVRPSDPRPAASAHLSELDPPPLRQRELQRLEDLDDREAVPPVRLRARARPARTGRNGRPGRRAARARRGRAR